MFKIIKLLSINFLVFLFLFIIGFAILEIISSNSEKKTDQKGSLIFDYSLGWDSYPPIEKIGKNGFGARLEGVWDIVVAFGRNL